MNLPENTTIGLIGEGSWATAIIKLLQNQPGELQWYIRTEEIREGINKNGRNPLYLSDVHVNQTGLIVSGDIRSVVSGSDIIVVVLPAAFIESTFSELSSDSFEGKFLVSAVKGMIPELEMTPCEFFHKRFGIPSDRLAFITGPSHAEEVALERLTFLTVHGENTSLTERMASLLACQYIRTKTGNDLQGAEYATAMKNIMSIGAGLIHSLGYGDNLLAVYVSKAIEEIQHFVDVVAPNQRNIMDKVYLGDLLVTSYSQFSRNRTFGAMLGKGYTVRSAQIEMNMIAEGYYATAGIHSIALKKEISLPITEAIYNILYQRFSPSVEMKLLIEKLN